MLLQLTELGLLYMANVHGVAANAISLEGRKCGAVSAWLLLLCEMGCSEFETNRTLLKATQRVGPF